MGSIFAVPVAQATPEAFKAMLAAWPGESVGTALTARVDIRKATWREPVLLVMGSEGPGLSPGLADALTRLVRIPMAGRLDSLNLAVAAAISLYQIRAAHLSL